MSGTSADGINVAFVRLGDKKPEHPSRGRGRPRHTSAEFKFLAHAEFPYPKSVRGTVLEAMNASRASVANLTRLNLLLGELYAEAVLSAQSQFRLKAELIGCHGQTLYHQGEPEPYLGRKLAVTWQTGEAAVIAARVGVPVISDFRPAGDEVSGPQGVRPRVYGRLRKKVWACRNPRYRGHCNRVDSKVYCRRTAALCVAKNCLPRIHHLRRWSKKSCLSCYAGQ